MRCEYLELSKHHVKTDELNKLGAEGWEMITALRMSGYFQMIFKRPLEAVVSGSAKPIGRPKGSKNKG